MITRVLQIQFLLFFGAQICTCSQPDPEVGRRWVDYGTVEVTCKTNEDSLDNIFYGWQLCLQEGGGDCCQVHGESNLTQCRAGEVTPLSKQDGNFTASIQIQVQNFTVQCWVEPSEGRVLSNFTVVDVRDSPFLPQTPAPGSYGTMTCTPKYFIIQLFVLLCVIISTWSAWCCDMDRVWKGLDYRIN
jgi:hypothetical protein